MSAKYQFLGVRVDDVTMDEAINDISRAIQDGRSYNIVTVNPELVMAAQKNVAFKKAINTADCVTPDGVGLRIMGWLTGRRLRQRVTGVDMCDRLAKEAADHGWRIFMLGAKPGVAQQAATNLQQKYSSLIIAGTSSADPQNDIKDDIISTKPNILLVAYGSPTQELWINQHAAQLSGMVTIGVGGSFDFIAGATKRAPRWIQKIGLEWLWRLILQPWRIKRIMALPKFAILTLFK